MQMVKNVFVLDGLLKPGKIFPAAKPGVQVGPAGQREMLDKVLGRV